MYRHHALPDNWETLSYFEFLSQRRKLIARVIKDAYDLIKEGARVVTDPKEILEELGLGQVKSLKLIVKSG